MHATLNGNPIALRSGQKHWAAMSRTWRNGDSVEVTLPSDFSLVRLPGSDAAPAAVMHGPVTMAFGSPAGNPSSQFDFENVKANFEPQPGEPLHYHLKSGRQVLARPFYEFKEGERYFMYLRPDLDRWVQPLRIAAKPNLLNTPWFCFTNAVESTIEYAFDGRSIRWTGYRFEDGGQAQVRIDGAVIGVVDQYGPAHIPATPPVGASLPFEWEHEGLSAGKHTLSIRTLAGKNGASKGHRITVARFDVQP